MSTIKLNSFVRRQNPESEFSHFEGTFEELERLCRTSFVKSTSLGYRAGVVLLNVDPTRFRTPIVELREGDHLVGKFEARREGETPRKALRVRRDQGGKGPARSCQIVVYEHATLAEDGDAETDADYEIIAINAVPTEEPAPIAPETLMHNHFGSDGGTDTKMTPEQFEAAMRESFEYWKDKAMVAPA